MMRVRTQIAQRPRMMTVKVTYGLLRICRVPKGRLKVAHDDSPGLSVSNSRQNRHPERSASQIYRVTQRFWRAVEGPRRCLSYPCCSDLFNHRSLHRADPPRSFPEAENLNLLVPVTIKCVPQQILFSGFGGRKGSSSIGKISTAGVLRLRARSAVSRDKSVRRSAQDDDFVGILTKNTLKIS
jgi:hypothetical protein